MVELLEIRDVTVEYADAATPVLASAQLSVEEGELVLVAGPTGSGKSTLLGVVTGLVPRFTGGHLSGDVRLDGRSVLHAATARARPRGRLRRAGPAGGIRHRHRRGGARLRHGAARTGTGDDATPGRGDPRPAGGGDLRDRDLRTLSGGQQQRVAIGSVLTMHPRLLVLDEPTSALDPTAAEEVLATLTRLVHDLGVSVLLAEHRLERVVPFADRMVLVDGEGGLRVGEPVDLLTDSVVAPPIVELGRAAGWSPLPLSVRDARRRATGLRERLAPAEPAPSPTADQQAAAQVRGVTVVHGQTVAVRDLSLSLAAGRVTALMGRNGSGKSSLLWAVQGSGARRSGSVRVGGTDPATVRGPGGGRWSACCPSRAPTCCISRPSTRSSPPADPGAARSSTTWCRRPR